LKIKSQQLKHLPLPDGRQLDWAHFVFLGFKIIESAFPLCYRNWDGNTGMVRRICMTGCEKMLDGLE